MRKKNKKKKIVILGGSGFIGASLYKELSPYYDTRASYCHNEEKKNNQHFFRYDMQDDDVVAVLKQYKPDIIISALRGDFAAQIQAHMHLVEYVQTHSVKLLFMSSANVFDAYSKFPSYEFDKTLSQSVYGRLKIKIENALLRLPARESSVVSAPIHMPTEKAPSKNRQVAMAAKLSRTRPDVCRRLLHLGVVDDPADYRFMS